MLKNSYNDGIIGSGTKKVLTLGTDKKPLGSLTSYADSADRRNTAFTSSVRQASLTQKKKSTALANQEVKGFDVDLQPNGPN